MYLVYFVNGLGQHDHDQSYGSLAAAMKAINDWFTVTNGKGECTIAYGG